MIRHIVMWKLRDEAEGNLKKTNALEIKKRLEGLVLKIPQIAELEVGLQMESSEAVYDVVLVSAFSDKPSLDRYQKNPDHLAVAEFVKKVAADRKVVDYEVESPEKRP